MIEDIAHWPSGTVRIAWHGPEGSELPLTGAHGFCFYQGSVLVCDISGRGLTIPGGHIDGGESAAECVSREASEEACVELANLRLLIIVPTLGSMDGIPFAPCRQFSGRMYLKCASFHASTNQQ
jgi:8-oxo-dGTP pyrophosphatase MutT (NUDIX family)